jgi:hypothetical protein
VEARGKLTEGNEQASEWQSGWTKSQLVHRARVASRRAVELVVERGGFVLPGDEPEAEIQDSAA